MARMHSRKGGKSRSTKEVRGRKPEWVELSDKEIIKMIIDLANQGTTKSRIGLILRDSYGIPSVRDATGKNISQILIENDVNPNMPEDLLNLLRTSVSQQEHMEKNHKDMTAQRGYNLAVAKIRRLGKYYIKKKRLPKDWRYDKEQARLLVK